MGIIIKSSSKKNKNSIWRRKAEGKSCSWTRSNFKKKDNKKIGFSRIFLKEKDRQQREENLKKAKDITITEDSSLPKAKVVC